MDDLDIGRYTIPGTELAETFETSSGPGGQHANRSATAVRLRFEVSKSSLPEEVLTRISERLGDTVEVACADSRSQFRNRAIARRRLKEKLEQALKEKPKRKKTRPTRAAKRRRLANKRARSEKKRLRQPPRIDD